MNFGQIRKIYFLGIGGIGMSNLARYFSNLGFEIFGYDKTATALTKKLAKEGMQIHYQEDIDLIPKNIDIVIYTPAIPSESIEKQWFINNDYKLYKRSEVLGMISKNKRSIAIAGTHGKTTTSSILTFLLHDSKLKATGFVGGLMKDFDSNFVAGDGDWVIVEADEFDRSFWQLSPDLAVILALDADHLDIYGDPQEVINGFRGFTAKIENGGKLWIEHRAYKMMSKEWKSELKQRSIKIKSFGIEKGDVQAQNIRVEKGMFLFDYCAGDVEIQDIKLPLAGRHNVSNATVALAIADHLGVSLKKCRKKLKKFKGIQRRFEIVAKKKKQVLIDDYAHHPEELKAAINAAKELYPGRKITGVFQPHLYSRTRDFVEGFATELDKLDQLILLDIYPAREEPIEGVTSAIIYDKLKLKHKKLIRKDQLIESLKKEKFEVLLILGAGDIGTEVEKIRIKYF